MAKPVLEVRALNAFYRDTAGGLLSKNHRRQVLHDVSFELMEGEILGLVGESGSGKSTLARVVLGLEPDYQGQITHHTTGPQMVFQDPGGSLNPHMTVGRMLEEPLLIQGGHTRKHRRTEAQQMLEAVGLEPRYLPRYPGELSGGQRQRVSIAAALIARPRLLIADEPVSALDATVQAQVLDLLWNLHQKLGLSYLLISHDLGVIEQMCNRVLVLQGGRIVEQGSVSDIFDTPTHPYTQALRKASRGE